jgi:glycosyltransferase involved in cell wall biosynthesis
MKLAIVIPAYNEEYRIRRTVEAYYEFFETLHSMGVIDFEIIVVLNGCIDKTKDIVQSMSVRLPELTIIDLMQAGKGLAIKAGFEYALSTDNDYIGFVDADMATAPTVYHELFMAIDGYDGIIASRYMKGATVYPPRPIIKRWGSRIFYESFVKLLFGLAYEDLQCGAKIFKRAVIEKITPELTVTQWAFDVELLFLCKKYGFRIREFPTSWFDQTGSKLRMSAGIRMFVSLTRLRLLHSPFKYLVE